MPVCTVATPLGPLLPEVPVCTVATPLGPGLVVVVGLLVVEGGTDEVVVVAGVRREGAVDVTGELVVLVVVLVGGRVVPVLRDERALLRSLAVPEAFVVKGGLVVGAAVVSTVELGTDLGAVVLGTVVGATMLGKVVGGTVEPGRVLLLGARSLG